MTLGFISGLDFFLPHNISCNLQELLRPISIFYFSESHLKALLSGHTHIMRCQDPGPRPSLTSEPGTMRWENWWWSLNYGRNVRPLSQAPSVIPGQCCPLGGGGFHPEITLKRIRLNEISCLRSNLIYRGWRDTWLRFVPIRVTTNLVK